MMITTVAIVVVIVITIATHAIEDIAMLHSNGSVNSLGYYFSCYSLQN